MCLKIIKQKHLLLLLWSQQKYIVCNQVNIFSHILTKYMLLLVLYVDFIHIDILFCVFRPIDWTCWSAMHHWGIPGNCALLCLWSLFQSTSAIESYISSKKETNYIYVFHKALCKHYRKNEILYRLLLIRRNTILIDHIVYSNFAHCWVIQCFIFINTTSYIYRLVATVPQLLC